MAIDVIGDLDGNEIFIDEQFREAGTGRVILSGSGIRINIRTSRVGNYFQANLDSGSRFEMLDNTFVASLDVHSRGGADISIGQNTFAIGRVRLYAHETALIRIGDGCLIGDDVLCMASDMHSIIDVDNDKRINPPDDIVVGDRVWIGAGAILLKGTTIGDGSVVGIRSVAMGEFPENCMLLGYPARLVRSGITWAEELRPL